MALLLLFVEVLLVSSDTFLLDIGVGEPDVVGGDVLHYEFVLVALHTLGLRVVKLHLVDFFLLCLEVFAFPVLLKRVPVILLVLMLSLEANLVVVERVLVLVKFVLSVLVHLVKVLPGFFGLTVD